MAGIIAKLLKLSRTIQPLMIGTFPTWMTPVLSKGNCIIGWKRASQIHMAAVVKIYQALLRLNGFTSYEENVFMRQLLHYLVKVYISLLNWGKESSINFMKALLIKSCMKVLLANFHLNCSKTLIYSSHWVMHQPHTAIDNRTESWGLDYIF